jgi:ketosteroid isomerase-like protein
MKKKLSVVVALCIALAGCAAPHAPQALARGDLAREQLAATERAFAKTMADRDLKAFASFLADDTVFFSSAKPLRGKQEVIAFWTRFYAKPQAPFSWEPKTIEVLDSGELGLSSGPVYDPDGKIFACYSSIWRQEAPGQWKIVFDRGTGPQECEKK